MTDTTPAPDTRSETERVYDDEIAPLLLQAAKKATAHNIPLLTIAEWSRGKIGETGSAFRGASFPFVFSKAAVQAAGNLDGFVFSVLKFCKEHGISTEASIVARLVSSERAN